MATYKEIKGSNVENFSSDPANALNGQVWYNTTSSTLKVAEVSTSGSWATGGNLNTGREALAAAGTQTVGLAFGGSNDPDSTEEYNGSSWTNQNNMNSVRS